MNTLVKKLSVLTLVAAILAMGSFSAFADSVSDDDAEDVGFRANRAAVQEALDTADYNAWLTAVPEGSPMLEIINEDNFDELVEAHEHMQSAKAIFDELGLEKPMGKKIGRHGGKTGEFGKMMKDKFESGECVCPGDFQGLKEVE